MVPVALIATAGSALVTAMVTDGWEGVGAKVARWFGQGDKKEVGTALERLDQSRAVLLAASGSDSVRTEQEVIWRTRIEDLLERYPDAEEGLHGLVAEITAPAIVSAENIQQHATASGQAQQAVQGQGFMSVTFGNQRGPVT
jgi:hypothetical protein